MTKQELRKTYLQKRQSLTEAEYLHLNHALGEVFFASFDLSFIKVIHTFLPLTEKHEPDTWPIIDRVRREFPHIRFSLPRVNYQTNELENYFFEGLHQLKKNDWGILEPAEGIPTPIAKINMVLVPLLVYDKQGHRVGYGKGYYDRFLSSCLPATKKIGLAHFHPVDQIEFSETDVRLNACVTPHGIFSFTDQG
jgi:5-formyltetrahydrofolate cyclo-ligase